MDDVRRELDRATRRLEATPEERAAVRAYQALQGHGERLNALLDAGEDLDDLHYDIAAGLDVLVRRAVAPRDLVVYRGVGDVETAVPPMLGEVHDLGTYMSTSLSYGVAREFAVGPRPAVLRMYVAEGVAALWVPPLGWRDLAYEQELLFPRGTVVRYGRRWMEDGMLVVSCEVVS